LRTKKSKKIKTSRLFYVSYFKFLNNCFLNFVVQKMNSKMVKCGMVVLTEREKADVADADVDWML
jgi:CRISPR/Cas system CMR-associated protein Cmr3 (group 5 of RAMP superfamily)